MTMELKQNVLHIAAFEGHTRMLELLLRAPRLLEKVDSTDRAGRTALHFASDAGAAGRLWNLAGLETMQRAYTGSMQSANGSSV